MNKPQITDEQVDLAMDAYCSYKPIWDYQNGMRAALLAAFPEQAQQPAAFGKLVVTEQMALHVFNKMNTTTTTLREPLQVFLDRHSIKPIAFTDRMPEDGQECYAYYQPHQRWCYYYDDVGSENYTHWLPASALPIPEPAVVDAKEAAWREYLKGHAPSQLLTCSEEDFKTGYEAAQAGGAK
jgi:hypothetical protein